LIPWSGAKAGRFIRYLRESFYSLLARRLAQEGLVVDSEVVNTTAAAIPARYPWVRDERELTPLFDLLDDAARLGKSDGSLAVRGSAERHMA
jgi:hypothetical protein